VVGRVSAGKAFYSSVCLPCWRSGDYLCCKTVQQYSMTASTDDAPEEASSETDEPVPERAYARYEMGQALSESEFGDVLVLSHEAADRALTPRRREIIETLATCDVTSVRDLADRSGRDPGNLSRDLQVLVAENVIRHVEDGRAKRPELKHDTIVVEPIVASPDSSPEAAEERASQ